MDLPNANLAIIDRAKLEGYLLSASHPVGRFKARFFARLGFTASEWRLFAQALREQHLAQAAFDFLPYRANLDLEGWADVDIFAH